MTALFIFCREISLVTEGERQASAVKTQLQQILRPMYSSPPLYGAQLATTVMSDPELKTLWFQEVKVWLRMPIRNLVFMVFRSTDQERRCDQR